MKEVMKSSSEQYRIEKRGDDRRIYYEVIYLDGRRGNASLLFTDLGEPPYDIPPEEEAERQGITAGEKIAGLSEFYPHGDKPEADIRPFMRKCVGARVLTDVLDDCSHRGCKILFVSTDSHSMMRFLGKQGFQEYCNWLGKSQWYIRVSTR